MERPSFSRFSRTDWHGDSIVVIVLGMLLLLSLLLPWATVTDDPKQNFTYSLTNPDGVRRIIYTDWGPPIAVAGVVVVTLGAVMLAFGPRRWTGGPVALALTFASLAVLYDVGRAVRPMWGFGYAAGLGVLVALIVAILLPIVALATAMTSRILQRQEAQAMVTAAADVESPTSAG